jgi:hypothetical protein
MLLSILFTHLINMSSCFLAMTSTVLMIPWILPEAYRLVRFTFFFLFEDLTVCSFFSSFSPSFSIILNPFYFLFTTALKKRCDDLFFRQTWRMLWSV